MITNAQSGTNIHEIATGIYRINTPVSISGGPGQFNFNQYLITDEASLLFHAGPRLLFPFVREAVGRVIPVEQMLMPLWFRL
jgi:preprotein translocase subunit SecB